MTLNTQLKKNILLQRTRNQHFLKKKKTNPQKQKDPNSKTTNTQQTMMMPQIKQRYLVSTGLGESCIKQQLLKQYYCYLDDDAQASFHMMPACCSLTTEDTR